MTPTAGPLAATARSDAHGTTAEINVRLPRGSIVRVTVVTGPPMTFDEAEGLTTAIGDWWRGLQSERVQDTPPDPRVGVRR